MRTRQSGSTNSGMCRGSRILFWSICLEEVRVLGRGDPQAGLVRELPREQLL
jgi:hypothetical protein